MPTDRHTTSTREQLCVPTVFLRLGVVFGIVAGSLSLGQQSDYDAAGAPAGVQVFRLARQGKQAMFGLSSMQRDAARQKKGSSKNRASFPTRPTPHVPIGKDDERDSREGQRSWQGVSLIQ